MKTEPQYSSGDLLYTSHSTPAYRIKAGDLTCFNLDLGKRAIWKVVAEVERRAILIQGRSKPDVTINIRYVGDPPDAATSYRASIKLNRMTLVAPK